MLLQDQLNQKRRDFSRVEREIELKIQAQEEHERQAALLEGEGDSEEEEREIGDQVHRQSEGKLCPANILLDSTL